MAKNFQNVTLGVGSFSINARDLGLTNGDAKATRAVETKDLEDGIPLFTQGRVPIRENHTLTIPMCEMTIQNLADVSLNVPRTIIPGTPVVVNDAANLERTFQPLFGFDDGIQFIRLPGAITSGLVIKDSTEVTTYTLEDDYFTDEAAGMVLSNPAGDISPGETVRVALTYTPAASERLEFGKNLPIQEKEVMFVHVSPVSGNIFTVFMPRAQFSGTLEANFQREEFMVLNAECKAIPDPDYPDAPLGFWDIELAA